MFLTVLPSLVISGMEHVLFMLLASLITFLAPPALSNTSCPAKLGGYRSLLAFCPLLVMTRYEGLFLVTLIATLYVFQKSYRQAAELAFLGSLPVLLYGVIFLAFGWHFLPNSILLKADLSHFALTGNWSALLRTLAMRFSWGKHVLGLMAAAVVALRVVTAGKPGCGLASLWTRMFLSVAMLHLTLFWTYANQFMRYERDLVALGCIGVVGTLAIRPRRPEAGGHPHGLPKLQSSVPSVLAIVSNLLPAFGTRSRHCPRCHPLVRRRTSTTNNTRWSYFSRITIPKQPLRCMPLAQCVTCRIHASSTLLGWPTGRSQN